MITSTMVSILLNNHITRDCLVNAHTTSEPGIHTSEFAYDIFLFATVVGLYDQLNVFNYFIQSVRFQSTSLSLVNHSLSSSAILTTCLTHSFPSPSTTAGVPLLVTIVTTAIGREHLNGANKRYVTVVYANISEPFTLKIF